MTTRPSGLRYEVFFIVGFLFSLVGQVCAEAKFEGKLIIQFKDAGERLELLENYYFIDASYKMWTARKGLVTDGASIPRWAWTSIGSPLGAPYVNAAVIHDQYCVLRTETPEHVHIMFYEAMIVAGVGKLKAKLMYAAVYYAGPWWDWRTTENARNAFKDNFIDSKWYQNPKSAHPNKVPPVEMFKKGPDGKPLLKCGDDLSCGWTELNEIEANWIAERVPLVKRTDPDSATQVSIANFVDTDPTLEEINKFLNKLGTQRK